MSKDYVRTKNRIYKVESETFDKQGYYIDRYEEDVKIKEEFLNTIKVCLTDNNIVRDTKGTKDNPYIYICHPREYEIWKSKLNLDENDMYVSADGWVKVVKTPENMFHSKVYKLDNR